MTKKIIQRTECASVRAIAKVPSFWSAPNGVNRWLGRICRVQFAADESEAALWQAGQPYYLADPRAACARDTTTPFPLDADVPAAVECRPG